MSGAGMQTQVANPYANAAAVHDPRLVVVGSTPMSTWPDRAVDSDPLDGLRPSKGRALAVSDAALVRRLPVCGAEPCADVRLAIALGLRITGIGRKTLSVYRLGVWTFEEVADTVDRLTLAQGGL